MNDISEGNVTSKKKRTIKKVAINENVPKKGEVSPKNSKRPSESEKTNTSKKSKQSSSDDGSESSRNGTDGKCTCHKSKCGTRKCPCFRASKKCTSKCHIGVKGPLADRHICENREKNTPKKVADNRAEIQYIPADHYILKHSNQIVAIVALSVVKSSICEVRVVQMVRNTKAFDRTKIGDTAQIEKKYLYSIDALPQLKLAIDQLHSAFGKVCDQFSTSTAAFRSVFDSWGFDLNKQILHDFKNCFNSTARNTAERILPAESVVESIVNAYLTLLCMNTSVGLLFTSMNRCNSDLLKNIEEIDGKTVVLQPLCIRGHWILLVHFVQERKSVYFDSLGQDIDPLLIQHRDSCHETVPSTIFTSALVHATEDSSFQRDSFSCSLFVIMFCHFIVAGIPLPQVVTIVRTCFTDFPWEANEQKKHVDYRCSHHHTPIPYNL